MAVTMGVRLLILVSFAQQQEARQKCHQTADDRHQRFVRGDQGIDETPDQEAENQVLEPLK